MGFDERHPGYAIQIEHFESQREFLESQGIEGLEELPSGRLGKGVRVPLQVI